MEYVYPPRPKNKIPPSGLNFEESRGIWLWQPKYDGDRCVIGIEDGRVFLGNRHGKWRNTSKLPRLCSELSALNLPSGITRLDAELVDAKKGIVVLFDVLQHGEYLLGVNQLDRLSLLDDICGKPQDDCLMGLAFQVSKRVWLAKRGDSGFSEKFSEVSAYRALANEGCIGREDEVQAGQMVEGLLLRQGDSVLDNYGASPYDVDWQLRCRCQHKNYRY